MLPGYQGILVCDGYPGYDHLTGALNAWSGAHLLRDPKDAHDAGPDQQEWAGKMGCLLLWARDRAAAARRDGRTAIDSTSSVTSSAATPGYPRLPAVRITTPPPAPHHTTSRHVGVAC